MENRRMADKLSDISQLNFFHLNSEGNKIIVHGFELIREKHPVQLKSTTDGLIVIPLLPVQLTPGNHIYLNSSDLESPSLIEFIQGCNAFDCNFLCVSGEYFQMKAERIDYDALSWGKVVPFTIRQANGSS